jgi:vacuolar-type H+-ATPase subunit E/Vma4
MLNEVRNPPRFIESRMKKGVFHGERHTVTSEGFGVILENIQSQSQIEDLIQELKYIIEKDPFMVEATRERLKKIRSKKTFLFECFQYVLSLKKGNTAERLRREEAKRIQQKAAENAKHISNASRDLYDEESDTENAMQGSK